jgi:hypothetical protein
LVLEQACWRTVDRRPMSYRSARLVILLFASLCALSALTLNPSLGYAQSAADKATARELAAEGIKNLQAGDPASAVRNLEKAQALYDAPIHLLYLGRAHARLGNLVEAAEAYRTLSRTELRSDAPAVFKQAQVDGRTELEELEPRIAKLTIHVEPEVARLEVMVNDKPLNVAALSVPRAANPGKHRIQVRARGYLDAEQEIELAEGAEETLRIVLEPGKGSGVTKSPKEDRKSEGEASAEKEDGFVSAPMGFILGLRIGGVLPVGELESGISMTDYFQPGFLGRGELGFRFLRYFGLKGYFGMGALSPGGALNRFAESQDARIVTKNSGGITDAGVALLATMDPRKIGGFGELGFSFLHRYQWTQTFSAPAIDCRMRAQYPGWAIRGGGGMNIPTGNLVNIVPAVDVSLGQFQDRKAESDCEEPTGTDLGVEGTEDRFASGFSQALHYQIFLGVGLDLHFGDGLFR